MDVFRALADPTRRQILELVARGPLPATSIARQFSISAPAVSQHLKVLREAGLVIVQQDAQRRMYSPGPDGLAELERWLENVRNFWNPRLDRLEAELRKE